MNFEKLKEILKKEPKYRLQQINQAIFKDLITDWSQAKNLPTELRAKLTKSFPLEIKARTFPSGDKNSQKVLLELSDGLKIESVLLKHNDGRHTICVSSQVGCPLGCLFCATGKMGFDRNLTENEIIVQVLFFARILNESQDKVTNVVFMGMGEPFLNYQSVIDSIKILNHPDYFNIGARHISISTIGITEGIKQLTVENIPVNLAISLHATDDLQRQQIIPMAQNYPIRNILKSVDNYIKQTNRRVMIEYLMIKDFNDSESQALELASLITNPLCFVNLISYNPTGNYKASSPQTITRFKNILIKKRIAVTQRYKFGADIEAACGQLATNN